MAAPVCGPAVAKQLPVHLLISVQFCGGGTVGCGRTWRMESMQACTAVGHGASVVRLLRAVLCAECTCCVCPVGTDLWVMSAYLDSEAHGVTESA